MQEACEMVPQSLLRTLLSAFEQEGGTYGRMVLHVCVCVCGCGG